MTGWPARAVEFFELLATTQYMNHVRRHAAATANLRDEGRLELAGTFQAGAFDSFAHTAEMRRIGTRAGRYNIQNVGIFLWRVQALRLVRSPLVDADDPGWAPLSASTRSGRTSRSSTRGGRSRRSRTSPSRWTSRCRCRAASRRRTFATSTAPGAPLLLETEDSAGVEPVAARSGSATSRTIRRRPEPGFTSRSRATRTSPSTRCSAASPSRRRPRPGAQRLATFHYGSALAIGGGGYDRAASLEPMETVVTVSDGDALGPPLTSVVAGGAVQILDSRRYAAPATITANDARRRAPATASSRCAPPTAPARCWRAASSSKLAMDADTTIVLDGLVLAGAPLVIEESADTEARHLVLRHCTLVPGITRDPDGSPHSVGRASLIVLHPFASVTLDHCVVGPVVAVEGAEVEANDSVIDASAEDEVAFCGRAPAGGGGLLDVSSAADRADRGRTRAGRAPDARRVHRPRQGARAAARRLRLAAARALWLPCDPWPAPVWAERRQVGCMRFSFVPPGSRTPRRFQCVGADPAHRPSHTSLRYGDPGYMQLRRSTHAAIRTGASDEGSMGVTHELHEPQRETNLRVRLDEYLRYGLEAGFFYAT